MPEWMSNRLMTPVYALLISFGAALVLGAAMNSEGAPAGQQPPPTDSAATVTIRLVTKQVVEQGVLDDVAPTALEGSQVRLYRVASDAALAVGKDGVLTLPQVAGPLTVCVSLPKGWTARGALHGVAPGLPCWELEAKTGVVDLLVVRGG